MKSGFLYGVFIGLLVVTLTRAFGETLGWLIIWSAWAIQLGAGAVVVWRRTRLPRVTAAFALGAADSALFAVFAARGVLLRDLLLDHPVAIGALLLFTPALMFSERWFSREKWDSWKRHAGRSTVLDIFTFSHIPNLRADP